MNKVWAEYINHKLLAYSAANLGRKAVNREFAEYLGVDPAYISHWTRGVRVPSGDMLDQVAARLGADAYEAAKKSARMPQNPFLWAIAKALPLLPEDIQRHYADEIEAIAKKSLETGAPVTKDCFRTASLF
jgi:transcriptional regulator with XRE-family HTH domain